MGLEKESLVWLLHLKSRLLIADKCFAALNVFVGVGRKHYLISAWFAVSRALDTLKNSVQALYPKMCLSCLVKVKWKSIKCNTCYPGDLFGNEPFVYCCVKIMAES